MFQNFIVLGIIPGTSFQISFQLWLTTVSTAIMLYAIWENRVAIRMELAILRIRLAIVSHQLVIK